jgi:hypothetical protein
MKDQKYHFRNWLLKATIGLSLIGFGACLVAEAAMLKYGGSSKSYWFWYGLVALVVLNSGVCLVGDAVKHKVHLERHQLKRNFDTNG